MLLDSFFVYLANRLFKTYLEDNETIIFVAHKHIWTHAGIFLKKIFLAFVLPLIIWLFLPTFLNLVLIWLFVGALSFMYAMTEWYYDALLITNLSLLSVKWNGFFDVSCNRIEYPTIEAVSWAKKGFMQMILGYGDVNIEKIGGAMPFLVSSTRNPQRVEREIMKRQSEVVEENTIKNHNNLKQLLASMITRHNVGG